MVSTLVTTWQMRGGRLVKAGSPGRGTTVVGRKKSLSISVSPVVGGSSAPPVPYPTYTDYPAVDWTTLDTQYSSRNLNSWAELPNMSTVLRSLSSRAYVKLPDGFRGKISNFNSGGTQFGVFAPNCMGMWGNGPNKAVIWMEPNSSTMAANIPVQSGGSTTTGNGIDGASNPYTMMRLGPMNSSTNAAVHNYGFAMCGTDQPVNSNGEPHMYSGLMAYMGSGSTDEWLTICGVPGDWNSPPGETFQYAMYRTKTRSWARFVEIDGLNVPGVSTGGNPTDFNGTAGGRQVGSAVGNNGALDIVFEDLYVHDTYIGGPTVSGAGGPDGTVCQNPTFTRMRSHRNANHGPHAGQNSGGKTFGGFNIEGTLGTILLDQPDFRMSNEQTYQKEHVSIANMLGDATVIINEPRWDSPLFGSSSGFVSATNGCFIFKIPDSYPFAGQANSQRSTPQVTVLGQPLQVVHRFAGQGWPSGLNPATQMIYVH
jgi:hypothetical protein